MKKFKKRTAKISITIKTDTNGKVGYLSNFINCNQTEALFAMNILTVKLLELNNVKVETTPIYDEK